MNKEQRERFAGALRRVAGDCDLLVAMAAMVSDDAPQVCEDLRQELENGDLARAAASGHKLKGMLSTFETESPVLELQDCILAARAGNASEAQRAFKTCESGINQLLTEIVNLGSSVEA